VYGGLKPHNQMFILFNSHVLGQVGHHQFIREKYTNDDRRKETTKKAKM
jgi:hypothetical protein